MRQLIRLTERTYYTQEFARVLLAGLQMSRAGVPPKAPEWIDNAFIGWKAVDMVSGPPPTLEQILMVLETLLEHAAYGFGLGVQRQLALLRRRGEIKASSHMQQEAMRLINCCATLKRLILLKNAEAIVAFLQAAIVGLEEEGSRARYGSDRLASLAAADDRIREAGLLEHFIDLLEATKREEAQ